MAPEVKRRWWRLSTILLLAPFLLLVIAGTFLGIRELIASRELQQRLQGYRNRGIPIDDATMEADFEARTSKQYTKQWSEITRACNAAVGNSSDLPIIGSGSIPPSLIQEQKWEQAEQVNEFLERVQPILQKLHSMPVGEKPVWQPIVFEGFGTLLPQLQDSRTIQRLLTLDFYYALHKKDRHRALQDLESMSKVAAAYDWSNCLVADLVNMALEGMLYNQIQQGLSADLWQAEDMPKLAGFLKSEHNIQDKWPQLIASERAMALSSLGITSAQRYSDAQEPLAVNYFSRFPSVRLSLLKDYERLETKPLQASTTQDSSFLFAYFAPACSQMIEAYDRQEDERRIMLIGLAIKEFQLKHNRWPETLTELEQSQLGQVKQWQSVKAGEFGYVVNNDTNIAYIWNVINDVSQRIAATLPIGFDPVDGSEERGRKVITLK